MLLKMKYIIKKILIILITIITLIIFYYLLNFRQKIIKKKEVNIEGFSGMISFINLIVSFSSSLIAFVIFSLINPITAVITSVIVFFLIYILFGIYLNHEEGLRNIIPDRSNYTLSNYFIKSSFNSGYTGYVIDVKNIKTLLQNGVRFFDFEIGLDNDIPIIGIINNVTKDNITTYYLASNFVLLDNFLEEIITNCFSSVSPNPKDPVFIQFRIKTNNTTDIYNKISDSIQYALNDKLYKDKSGNIIEINKNTLLNDILGKIIIVVDTTIIPITEIKTSKLGKYVNIYSGTNIFLKNTFEGLKGHSYTQSVIDGDTVVPYTKETILSIVCPDNNINPNVEFSYDLIKNYGVNVILFPFYTKNLVEKKNYNNIFTNFKTSFVPMNYAINYSKKIA
jgi:hypothetical protein